MKAIVYNSSTRDTETERYRNRGLPGPIKGLKRTTKEGSLSMTAVQNWLEKDKAMSP